MATKKKSPKEITAPAAKSKKSPAKTAATKESAYVAAAAEGSSQQPLQPQLLSAELHEEIRTRAYQIYCERGGEHGQHESDWRRAELEVRAKYDK